MAREIKVAPSILAADFAHLKDEIRKIEESGADIVHVDVMDGHFVRNITIGPLIVKAIRPHTKLVIDSHLMIENPHLYIEDFARAGSDIITIHAECYGEYTPQSQGINAFPKEVDSIDIDKARKGLELIRKVGARPSITLNPGTPLCIEALLKDVEKVLVMSVDPGFAGQSFKKEVLPKVERLKKIFKGDIEIDGGINGETAPLAVKAGADILVTGSYFFKAEDPAAIVKSFKSIK